MISARLVLSGLTERERLERCAAVIASVCEVLLGVFKFQVCYDISDDLDLSGYLEDI